MPITVARISIAPVKSLGLLHPDEIALDRDGAAGDRRFWLTDAGGRLLNNKRNGPLALVRPSWDEDAGELSLAFPDGEVVAGTVELGPEVDLELYGSHFPSRPVLGPWNDRLAAFAGEPVVLYQGRVRAPDRGAPGGVSLVSRASLADLGEEAGAPGPLDGRRFRMLFELDGAEAYEEDGWIGRPVRIGSTEVVVRGDVGRCLVTSQNPDTGVADVDTLGALARYRRDGATEPLPLGVYGEVTAGGLVRVGDVVVPAGSG